VRAGVGRSCEGGGLGGEEGAVDKTMGDEAAVAEAVGGKASGELAILVE
jgi:hypothetical protein